LNKYQENYSKGTEYQDYVVSQMLQRGFPICLYSSRKYQFERGESANGIEIKYDGKMAETGNLYIETAEKSDASNAYYVKSGVMRMDNTWAYLIGDYHEAFLLSVRQLRRVSTWPSTMKKRCGVQDRETPTSQGYTIPKDGEFMRKWLCINHFIFEEVQQNVR
jgi:hypothetical protein